MSFLCVAYAVPRDFDVQPGPSAFQLTYDQGQCLSCAAKYSLNERPWATKQVQVGCNVICELEAVQTCAPICLHGHPLISTRAWQLNVCNAGMSIRTVRMCECECVGGCVGVCVCECVGGCVCTCECVTRVQHHKHNPLCVGDAVLSNFLPCLLCTYSTCE